MKLCWIFIIWFLILERCYGGQTIKNSANKQVTHNAILIKLMIHIDQPLTQKLASIYHVNTRKKLKTVTSKLLDDVKQLFLQPALNQTVNFKLIDTKFLRNNNVVTLDENAPKYLKSYCDWQSVKKTAKKIWYYSVLLTGLDLFHFNNGRKVKNNSGRGYTRGICHVKKSCAVIEWDLKHAGFLLAHEIGHSLGMRHDGPPYNQCKSQQNVMALRYNEHTHPRIWSRCSWYTLRQFLKSSKAWCLS